jgi:5'-3' exonuclease
MRQGEDVRSRVVLAVDGNSLVHRSFHAQAGTGLRSSDGAPIWAVRGLLVQLVGAVERIGPDIVVVGFDDADSSWRRENWPRYKAHRGIKLDSLVSQLALAVEVLRRLGITVVVPDGLEADDVLASTARAAAACDATTVIVTSDRDAFALIDERTHVMRIINGGVECSPLITADRLVTLLGVRPDQYADYAALRGDPSDNLPGVRGIGPKTATRLLAAAGSARAAFDDLGSPSVVAAIGAAATRCLADADARSTWELNRQVMGMRTDVDVALGSAAALPLDADTVRAVFCAMQLTWTTSDAVRVLCGQGPPVPDEAREIAWHSVPADAISWARRPPPLTRRIPATDQLALFD